MAALEQETPGAEGGALPFDIEQWLNDNKLGDYKDEFIKQQIAIEELLPLTQQELKQVAQEDFGIKSIIQQNRFVKAVQKLVKSSQKFGNENKKNNDDIKYDNNNNNNIDNNIDNNNKSTVITKEEQQVLTKIKLQIKKMRDINNGNDYNIKNINIMSNKCENDINHLFDQFINALKNRQKELVTKTKQITNNKLLIINQQKTEINKYINQLKEFANSWSELMLNQNNSNNEPGQSINERKQKIISISTQLLQKENTIQILKNEININLLLTEKERENINLFISKIGYIDSNQPANPPIININNNNITDITAQIAIDFSNNCKLSLPQKYCLQIADYDTKQAEKEEEKGELDDDEFKWKEIVTNGEIDENGMDKLNKTIFLIKDLKCNTKYILQCKCCNKYGWSKFCKYIIFKTKDKIFRMESNILSENEKQIFYKNILISKFGKKKNELNDLNVALLYRASRDGFGADKFHAKCDGKKKTIVLVESNLGNVFGGYSKIAWSSDNKWHTDASCFLFLCRDLNKNNKNDFEIYPIKQSYHSKAVKHYSSHGPCFGKGHDLLIVNAANITDSRSDGESFVNLKGNILTGSLTQIHNKYWHFVVRDYEVFHIINN